MSGTIFKVTITVIHVQANWTSFESYPVTQGLPGSGCYDEPSPAALGACGFINVPPKTAKTACA